MRAVALAGLVAVAPLAARAQVEDGPAYEVIAAPPGEPADFAVESDVAPVAPAAASDVIVIAPAAASDVIVIEPAAAFGGVALEPVAGAAVTADSARTWLTTELSGRLAIDGSFDGDGEDVVEWWNLGRLKLDYRLGALRAVAEGRARWSAVGRDTRPDYRFAVVNAKDPRWTGEGDLREAYVQLTSGGFELSAGQRLYSWGKNELAPPADVLNPADLRYDPLAALAGGRDAKVPVLAVDLAYTSGRSALRLVVLPFFTANRARVLGRDFALAPPGSDREAQLRAIAAVHPSVADELQDTTAASELPEESPENASVALRGTTSLGGWDLGATAYYGWDRSPRVRIDRDLQLLFENGARILADPQALASDPVLRDASLAVQQKGAVGQELVVARYKRLWRLALEAEGVLGDLVVRADAGWSPRQVFYDANLRARARPTASAVLGVEYTRGSEWFVSLAGVGLAVFTAPHDVPLLGLEAASINPATRDVAWVYGAGGTVRFTPEDVDFDVEAGGLYAIEPRMYLARAELGWRGLEPHRIGVGGVLLGGDQGSFGSDYGDNDFAYVSYKGIW